MADRSTTEQGFALLLSIIVASILLAIGLTMLTITTKQLTLSSVSRESERAFQAATAGLECLRMHRSEFGSVYTAPVISATAQNVTCFNASPSVRTASTYDTEGASKYTNQFKYMISWGNTANERCTTADMFVMVNNHATEEYDLDLSYFSSIEGADDKTCGPGQRCTLLVVQGYNKSCADVNAGLATVQRELSAQF